MPFSALRPRITRSSAAALISPASDELIGARAQSATTTSPTAKTPPRAASLARACRSAVGAKKRSSTRSPKPYPTPTANSTVIRKDDTPPPPPATRRKIGSTKLSPAVSSASDDELAGTAFDDDGPRFLRQVNVTAVFDDKGQLVPIEFEAGIAKGFFQVRSNWTCYRRYVTTRTERERACY